MEVKKKDSQTEMAPSGEDLQMPPLIENSISDLDQISDENLEAEFADYYDEDIDKNTMTTNLKRQAAKETRKSLARTETKAVSCLRWVVLLVIFVTAVGVSVAAYMYARSVENNKFESEFGSVALVTLRSFVEAVEHNMNALDTMALQITTVARATGQSFPNVTLPDWEVAGAAFRAGTGSIFAVWLPLVTDETRAGYEAYCQLEAQQGHVFQSYFMEEGYRQFQDAYFGINATKEDHESADGAGSRSLHIMPPDEHPLIHKRIWGRTDLWGTGAYLDPTTDWAEPEGMGNYLPMWQMSPAAPLPSAVNFNMMAFHDLKPVFQQTIDTGKAVLSHIQTNHSGGDTEDLIRIFMSINQFRHQTVGYDEDPLTQITYPVFDSFYPKEKKLVGMIFTTIFWRLLFNNVLSENVKGVICVLSNSLGDAVTYRIDGRNAALLGTGDLHERDTKYDSMTVTRDIAEYMSELVKLESTSYTAVELDAGYSSYRLSVHPSKAMEDSYRTSDAILYSVAVFLVFVFTSLVFVLYDSLVERRQKKVMDTAVKSTAVVKSIFPENVLDRLNAEADESMKDDYREENVDTWKISAAANIHESQALRSSIHQKVLRNNNQRSQGRPIADKFDNVTVLFADLVGFTKWSASREPEQVFTLLETLYGAFDRAAMRRQVFKVETIGDCYMAATGLPKSQADHATRMAKFSTSIIHGMSKLLSGLEPSLGSGTMDLAVRVGLHSGSVTAGVLRGDKGRFQLFGKTVNFASRMESTGVPGRIHCSEATAMNLPKEWLSVRSDKVQAKGLGEVTTFFVDIRSATRSSMSLGSCGFDTDEETVDNENLDASDVSQRVGSTSSSQIVAEPKRSTQHCNAGHELMRCSVTSKIIEIDV